MDCKQTFQGFVNSYNATYERNQSPVQFKSLQMFIEWFFGWASHMEIDFRQVCEVCGDSPKVLACDGTKIGIGFKHSFIRPIEESDSEIQTQQSRRLDRYFLFNPNQNPTVFRQYAAARKYLKVICRHIISNAEHQFLNEDTSQVSDVLPSESLESFNKMVEGASFELRVSYAMFFLLLSYNSSLDAVIPLDFVNNVLQFAELGIHQLLTHENVAAFSFKFKLICPELSDLICVSSQQNDGLPASDIFNLLRYCAHFASSIHENDVDADIPLSIDDSYNPPKY